jgi:hypothetical protein
MKFLKQMSYFLFFVMCLSLILLVPIYVTGSASPEYQTSDFSKMTVINTTATPERLWASFIIVILISLLGLYVVYRYQVVSLKLKHVGTYTKAKISEKDIALHTVYVKHLPRDISPT